jgi:anti-sigma factor RsiW
LSCVSPPELDDKALLAWIDGEADRQVVAHLEGCPHCREKAHRLNQLQGRLTAQLYRITCPTPVELGEYHLGLLPPGQAATLARHVDECPHCTREVSGLKHYLGELAPDLEFSPMERIKVLVARIAGTRREDGPYGVPTLAPAYLAVRGEEEAVRLYRAGTAQIAIGIEDDAGQPDRKMLLGLVTGIEVHGMEAHIWQDDRQITQVPVDALGNFVIPGLAPSGYVLILSGPDVEIHIQDLDVGMG